MVRTPVCGSGSTSSILVYHPFCEVFVNVLKRPSLILNKNWMPISVATVERAICLVCKDAARVVDTESYQLYSWEDWAMTRPDEGELFIQSVRQKIRVPEVITLNKYDRVPSVSVAFSRRNLYKRDHYCCQYCGVQPPVEDLTIDHIIPKSSPCGQGKSTWENCVLACIDCNKKKADLPLEKSGLRLRKKPVRPGWKALYAVNAIKMYSWTKFISEAYWSAELQE